MKPDVKPPIELKSDYETRWFSKDDLTPGSFLYKGSTLIPSDELKESLPEDFELIEEISEPPHRCIFASNDNLSILIYNSGGDLTLETYLVGTDFIFALRDLKRFHEKRDVED